MSEKPIIFSGEMVRAILDGRKIQTRRVVDCPPDTTSIYWTEDDETVPDGKYTGWVVECGAPLRLPRKCPYGQPGDRLWVRETWADVNTDEGPSLAYRADGAVRTWHDFSETFGPDYGAGPSMDYEAYPGDYCMWYSDLLAGASGHAWKPSIFMPRWASRIMLEITGIRVERVQDISIDDAIDEGADWPMVAPEDGGLNEWRRRIRELGFSVLWDRINAKRGYGWDVNPMVWVIEFRRIDPQ